MLTQLLCHYWRSITLADLLTVVYLVVLVLFVIGCNHLFTNFVNSKPEGRKTVLGQLTVKVTKFMWIEVAAHPFLIPKFLNFVCSPARLKGTFCTEWVTPYKHIAILIFHICAFSSRIL